MISHNSKTLVCPVTVELCVQANPSAAFARPSIALILPMSTLPTGSADLSCSDGLKYDFQVLARVHQHESQRVASVTSPE